MKKTIRLKDRKESRIVGATIPIEVPDSSEIFWTT